MKIIFFATPDFAIPSLKILHESNHEIVGVVTALDKQRGRGRKVSYSPIKQFAIDNNLTVLQPGKMKDEDFITSLKNLDADLFVIVAFRILPTSVFTIPELGSFNLHGSLLPKYRGAAPIQWAIINGETQTGATTFFLKEKVDTGNIILQEKIEIKTEDSFEDLHDSMSEKGAELVLKTVNLIDSGNYELKEQDNSQATPAPKITKETCKIDWVNSVENIHNLIRGLSPYPGAFFIHDDKQFKIFNSVVAEDHNLDIGEIKQTKNELFIGCQDGSLQILEIQAEGRKRMNVEDFNRGFSFR
ncbi:MAG: methionyl-tRNA formyltransferase [Ignavibacteriae bacterium]|nr:methionyl-tRNA formyltransferase [Ignavibacteriota bacterium]